MRYADPTVTGSRRRWLFVTLFALCCAADAWVLRDAIGQRSLPSGEFRRGFFETDDGDAVSIVASADIDLQMLPGFLVDQDGRLAIPPGVSAVIVPGPNDEYRVTSDDPERAPLLLLGRPPAGPPATEPFPVRAPLAPVLTAGQPTWADWRGDVHWRTERQQLVEMRAACSDAESSAELTLTVADGAPRLRLGPCAWTAVDTSGATAVVMIAGPDWLRVARRGGWTTTRSQLAPLAAAIVLKQLAFWWGLGGPSAVAVSAALGLAAAAYPTPAVLLWPLLAALGIATALARVLAHLWRSGSAATRIATAIAAVAIVGLLLPTADRAPRPLVREGREPFQPARCAVIGYSTVKGEGLRRGEGSLRRLLDRNCGQCSAATGGLFAGGETIAWARDTFCAAAAGVGHGGAAIFLGAANDDFLTASLSIARLAVVTQRGPEAWRQNQTAAAEASLQRLAEQDAALDALLGCAAARGLRFLYLHDFLITDLAGGRDEARSTMLAQRRMRVEAQAGRFVDLLARFGEQVSVAWFNDYVHPSEVGHRQIADLACALLAEPAVASATNSAW